MNKSLLAAVLAATLTLTACPKTPDDSIPVVREFVCYDDGKLAERHALVRTAFIVRENSNSWYILYTDGNESRYSQRPGESCQLETFGGNPQ